MITDVLSIEGIYDLLLHSYFDPDCYKKAVSKNAGILEFHARVTISGDPIGVVLKTNCIGRIYDEDDTHRGTFGFKTEYVRINLSRRDDGFVYSGIVKAHYRMQRETPEQDFYPYITEWELYPNCDYDDLIHDEELSKSEGITEEMWKTMLGVLQNGVYAKGNLLQFKEATESIPELEIRSSEFELISHKLDELQFRTVEKFLALTKRKPLTME